MHSRTVRCPRLAVALPFIGFLVVFVAGCSTGVSVVTPVPSSTPTGSARDAMPTAEPTATTSQRTGPTGVVPPTAQVGAALSTPTVGAAPSRGTGPTPIKAKEQGLGRLTVRTLEGCRLSFAIKFGPSWLTPSRSFESSTTTTEIAAGTYDVVGGADIGRRPITETVVIREGEETVVDFTHNVGLLLLSPYPGLEKKEPLAYTFFAFDDPYVGTVRGGWALCALPGAYRIDPLGIIGAGATDFHATVKAGEKTIVGPESFPVQFGLMSFQGKHVERGLFQVRDFGTDRDIANAYPSRGLPGSFWVSAGTYRVILVEPYLGLTYEPVQIRAGEETILQLPE